MNEELENQETENQETLDQESEQIQEEETEENEAYPIDYTTYLQNIIDNQESIIFNQETLVSQNDIMLEKLAYQNNALKGITNIVVLAVIVVCGVWIVKNIFVKMM